MLYLFPYKWHRETFNEIFTYSVNLQLSSLMTMLLEPISKLMLGHYGNLSMVGLFEMANRLVMQVRSVIVNANQSLVPLLSNLHETEKKKVLGLYFKTTNILIVLSSVVYGILAVSLPFISELWIGELNIYFIDFSFLIVMGMFVNTLIGPVYFTNMATGDVIENTKSQIIIALLNIIFGIFLGIMFHGYGVIFAYASSTMVGSMALLYFFVIKNKIVLELNKLGLYLMGMNIVLACISFIVYRYYEKLYFFDLGISLLLNLLVLWINKRYLIAIIKG
ncbi:oligosaccharide flippase family protein [Sulfuricurvum sp.]|uniref:lipopolysaccharide biosynthesis protein n=1 Tax=Sulfuricurvum sp. TaxID=2025608 RepID=UPI00262FA192|nr:oligosaccharide flippase family protein [Sulfuricurvum sp.]MDD4950725.1 oligosaccharide flippase family protein [Sulfuricurvum sp.]